MKSQILLNKFNTLLLIIAAALIVSSNIWATKVWVENRTENPIKIKFSGKGNILAKVPKDKVRWGDNIFGLKLEWFSINGHKVTVPKTLQKGKFWYIYVEQRAFDLKFTLYKVNTSEVKMMHGTGLFMRIYTDIFTLGLFEAMWTSQTHKDIQSARETALSCVMSGLIDNQGTSYTKYDEKYIVNVTSLPLNIHATTDDGKKFDYLLPAQNGQFVDTIKPITELSLENEQWGTYTIAGDTLTNHKYFAVINGDPYQVATFTSIAFMSIDLFNSMRDKLTKYFKSISPEIARTMDVKYFINNTAKPIDIEMAVVDHKNQKITIPAQNVDMLAAPAKITSIILRDGEATVTLDPQTIEKFAGFYISNLKEKEGILYIDTEATDFKFPIATKNLWWQGAFACENIGE